MKKKNLIKEFRAEDLKTLTEQRADLYEQMEALVNTAKAEERALTDEEQQNFEQLESEIKSIDKTIDAEERAKTLAIEKKQEEKKEEQEEERAASEERAFEDYLRGNLTEERAESSGMTQGSNGAIVPATIAKRIISEVRDMCPFLSTSDVIYTNGKLSIPVYGEDDTHRINAAYVDEDEELTDNVGKFTTVDLTGYMIAALSLVSKKLINNTDFDIVGYVVSKVAEAMAEKLELEFVNGTTNKITGVISASRTKTAAAQAAITYDELVTLKHSIKRRYRGKAKWIMNPATYTAICKLKDENGQPYFKESEYKILGNEVIESDSMPEIAAGAKTIVFGDLTGYTIKATKTVEIQILKEKFATKGMIGIMAYGEFDAKVSDQKKISVLQMATKA